MDPVQRRYDMLTGWRAQAEAVSHQPVPSPADLLAIAGSPAAWPTGSDAASVEAWRPTIVWLLQQMKLGVSDPVESLPAELLQPTGTMSDAAAIAALMEWRERGVGQNLPGFDALRDQHLKTIVTSRIRTPEGIAKLLPSEALRGLSAEVARLLTSPSGDVEAEAVGSTTAQAPQPAIPPPPATERASERVSAPTAPAEAPASAAVPHDPVEPAEVVDFRSFEPYDMSAPPGEPGPLTATVAATGGWNLRWSAAEATGVALYRVVSRDDYAPYAPESADPVTVTDEPRALDPRESTSSVRHYQVWLNTGADVAGATRSQPVLHAAVSVVSQALDVDIRADGGRVIGQWRVFPGVERVQVYRIPIERARTAGILPEYRILTEDDNLGGFVDAGVVRGARYVYLVCVEAPVDGVTRLSSASRVEVAVPAVLTPVTDLAVEAHGEGDGRVFDLSWTDPPAGRVQIYRTPTAPRAGAGTEARPTSALPQMQLADGDRLSHPIRPESGGRSSMREVPWPDGWTRAYFTPVTVLDGTAHVGTTTSATWVPPVGVPRVVERVDRQVLTFAWPTGAASVLAYVAPRGASSEAARGGRASEISRTQYQDLGGLAFSFQLPATGCSIHIVPVAFAAGEKVEGAAVAVDYAGLLRLRYATSVKRGFMGKPATMMLDIVSSIAVEPPPFVLVHNPDRLPLDVGDGTALEVALDGDETMAVTRRPTPARLTPDELSRWRVDVKNVLGYVRLFVDLPPEMLQLVALMDPPVKDLRLDPLFGGRT
jgi:hypothetical protein